jgi:hypothetical protein
MGGICDQSGALGEVGSEGVVDADTELGAEESVPPAQPEIRRTRMIAGLRRMRRSST